ncbi:threonine/homoserine/homoserine lactone efflux protein [Nocardioides zeae]|uniref:Threonine/homoserine/homoserine lactone efflux protein n=2 Tax=Nocardioides zeae TaxID=1457234 RepID=A0AAJ1U8E5_9ACTN|nr:LysE family translocator [Nocardioides zeae]MDQ1106271.1 threonine/homoserine/homoserine lactone efflux protein [Nocardioides zeae]MDR6174043.1 threonine/homoserine/homoserine lactone efflux protein [Nocardioides zeae]MDR6211402.1 threonine/homoserine/homoserine lactone efflux protein [Nocardioides zeae]
MPELHQWGAFLLASLLFIQLPGPSLLFTIGRALTVGRRDALLSVVGNGTGIFVQVLLVAVGLGAVVAASATAYTVVKIVGAVYVVYLGIQAVRHRADARRTLEEASAAAEAAPATSPLSALRVGALVGVTNPKTLVFFVAFLPQFTDPSAGTTGLQVATLGLAFAAMAVVSDSVWALVASQARAWFARRPARLDRLGATGGVMMVGLGASMLVADR